MRKLKISNIKVKDEVSGTSWETFYNTIYDIFNSIDPIDEKLDRIINYVNYLNEYGGIGELLTLNNYIRLGGICFDCKNAIGNCAIINKNKIECKYFVPNK